MRQLVARHSFPSVPDDVVQKFKERNQVKNELRSMCRKFQAVSFVIDDQEIFSLMKISTSVFTPDAKVVVDGVNQIPVFRSSQEEGPRHPHCQGHQRQAHLGHQDRQSNKYTEINSSQVGQFMV
jgi:hypothetical protein